MPRPQDEIHAECEVWGEQRVQQHVDARVDDPDRMHRLEWLNGKARERMSTIDPEWWAVPGDVQRAMLMGWGSGMPHVSSALYARWWQLETWLRSLIYVELRAAHGSGWAEALPGISELRQEKDGAFHYMPTPDAQNRLAYADASALFKITIDRWELFSRYFPSRTIWAGRVEELLAIRNRIGHCRRPHSDDLTRLEQALRDLNNGAFLAASAFNEHVLPGSEWTGAVADGWVRRGHQTALRLIEHAERQYDVAFELRCSCRPWVVESWRDRKTIDGIPGYIWHVVWYLRGGRPLHLDRFWRDIRRYQDIVLLVCADSPTTLSVSFSALEDADAVSDAIGRCFDALLMALGPSGTVQGYYASWSSRYADLDTRVHVGVTPWTMVEESMSGVSIFSA